MTDAVRDKRLFDTFRSILGRGLTQAEVDRINAALYYDTVISAADHTISPDGIAFIHGFESYKATTYPDPGPTGKPITGGWGTTTDENGKPFAKVGLTFSKDYWDRLFERDMARFVSGVNTLLAGAPTTQNQFDALVSFAYNVGLDNDGDGVAEGLGDSTLLRKHKAGDYEGAANEFPKWNRAKGKVLNGLIRRRAEEAAIYRRA